MPLTLLEKPYHPAMTATIIPFTTPAGQRTDEAPEAWPFGTLTPLQQRRHDEQRAALRRIHERQHRERVEDSLRWFRERFGEATM